MTARIQNPSTIAVATLLVTSAAALGLLATGALFPEESKPKKKKKKTKPTGKTEPKKTEPKKTEEKDEPKKKAEQPPKKEAPPESPPEEPPEAPEPLPINNGILVNATCTKAMALDREALDDVITEGIVDYIDIGFIDEFNLNSAEGVLQLASTITYQRVLKRGFDTQNCPGFVIPWQTPEEFDQISKFEKALWLLVMLRTGLILFESDIISPAAFSTFVERMNVIFTDHNIDEAFLKQAGLG